ncbi:MAG: hypothetical protein M4D80_37690 [Myxococcota bacterium]|nr:hypothetical protein [Myxococcota bacterium]
MQRAVCAIAVAAVVVVAIPVVVAECSDFRPHSGPAYAKQRARDRKEAQYRRLISTLIVDEMKASETATHELVRDLHRQVAEVIYELQCHDREAFNGFRPNFADVYDPDCHRYADRMGCYRFETNAVLQSPEYCWRDVRVRPREDAVDRAIRRSIVRTLTVDQLRAMAAASYEPVRRLHWHAAETLYEMMCHNRDPYRDYKPTLADIYHRECLAFAAKVDCYAFRCDPTVCPQECYRDVRMNRYDEIGHEEREWGGGN